MVFRLLGKLTVGRPTSVDLLFPTRLLNDLALEPDLHQATHGICLLNGVHVLGLHYLIYNARFLFKSFCN